MLFVSAFNSNPLTDVQPWFQSTSLSILLRAQFPTNYLPHFPPSTYLTISWWAISLSPYLSCAS